MAVKTMTATTAATGARRGSRQPARSIDKVAYGKLLLQTLPHVIKTEAENERMIAELERLDTCGRTLTPEEERLAELMTVLVRQFEEERYPLGEASPIDVVRVLMENHGLRQRDLIPVFGASSVVSDVLNGKRSISKAHARKLAEFFHVPVGLFV
jgi:HTH-type transcriptional regulator/antitoxin HigA